jgi:hypothetical protein
MPVFRLQNFGGMIPAIDERLLPENQAALSQNTWLVSGAVEGFRIPTAVYTLANETTKRVYRIPQNSFDRSSIPDSYWMEFDHPYTDVISSPSVGDSFERFYWASPATMPRYNTKARIIAGDPDFILGIPAPTVAPAISIAGGVAPTETRAYVYTWVSAYGEEGPPSPPTLGSGNASGTWTITVSAPGGAATDRNITKVRIYRTVTGTSGSTTYFFLTEMNVSSASFADTSVSSLVAANNILRSTFYEPPPLDLQGMTTMPNGMVAGWRKNEVWFAEPYRPHAWPSPYTLAVEGEIIGLGVVGQTLIACTTGSPYAISGVNPAAMSVSRMSFFEACLSRGSILSSPFGVVYASPNGLVIANPGLAQVATRGIFSKSDWLDPDQVAAVSRQRGSLVNGAYYAWGSRIAGCFQEDVFENTAFTQFDYEGAYDGLYLDINNPRVSYVRLVSDTPTENCFMDNWTGETLLIRDGQVLWMDIDPARVKSEYLWRSKNFEMPNKRNLEAIRVHINESDPVATPMTSEWYDTKSWDDTGFWYDTEVTVFGKVRVYADGRLVFARDIHASGEFMRLPSGFKATYWQIEIEARAPLKTIEIATTAKELALV